MNDPRRLIVHCSIIIVLSLTSCKDNLLDHSKIGQEKIEGIKNKNIEEKSNNGLNDELETFIYEGCEYLIYISANNSNSAYGFMAHKGNFSNPIHIYNSRP